MKDFYNKIRDFAYYLIILIISILATCFLPMIGSEVNVNYAPPTTAEEWTIFLAVRFIAGILNVMIFFCFTKQAEVNVKDNPNYIRANEILNKVKEKHPRKPKSPAKFKLFEWSSKATSLLISSILATFTLAGIILRFDITQFLCYIFVIVLGIFFGYFTMRKHETYWTQEYLEYAIMVQKQEEENNVHSRQENV